MTYESTTAFFHKHLESVSLAVDDIAEVIEQTAAWAQNTLVSEGKIFSCGLGHSVSSAVAFSALLRQHPLRERPALPVIELSPNTGDMGSTTASWLSSQLMALGQPGDLAVVFAHDLLEDDIDDIAAAVEKRAVNTVWVGAPGPGMNMTFPDADPLSILALNHACAICLANAIDINTFGPLEEHL